MQESPSSVNSFELMQDIHSKLSQPSQPFTYKLQLARSRNTDLVDQDEQVQFLQFKQQLFLKRLIELRQNHDHFLQQLPALQEALVDALKQKLTEVGEQSQQVLKDQEALINNHLKEI